MSGVTLQQIEHAGSDEELLALLRLHLRMLSPAEVATLPPHCVPHDLRDTEDIADWALALTKCRIERGDDNRVLAEMEQLFARACVRVSQLLDRTGKWRRQVRVPRAGEGESDNQ